MSSGASLCGPTNALSSLQKHTTADRSLQQDHLRTQAGPSSSFRSGAAGNVGHEFEQFSNPARFPQQDVQFLPRQQFSPQIQQPAPIPNWAAEFQRMTLQQAPIIPAAFNHPKEPRGSWHTEFLAQQPHLGYMPQAPQSHFYQQQQHQTSSSGLRTHSPTSMYSSQESYSPQETFYTTSAGAHHEPIISAEEKAVTDAAFDRAFEEAQRWQFEMTEHDELDAIFNPFNQHDELDAIAQSGPIERADVGAEIEVEAEREAEHDDQDDLSKTAGQLLDTLSQNQSKKFQESNFLALMRRLRDKEVKVEGGEMVEVGEQAQTANRPVECLKGSQFQHEFGNMG
ncbi:hypothetical protein DFH27DRAFT_566591 [Peziza echinospora]|nr:hypothetical protein DFH27DRAFT_566591 [Peziza echinospora]